MTTYTSLYMQISAHIGLNGYLLRLPNKESAESPFFLAKGNNFNFGGKRRLSNTLKTAYRRKKVV